ncbi:MAG: phage terminase family protein, partial [Actinomycetota bacterium]|nr:phage terminase family protein [Actinomycetota bacterium]
KYDVLELACDPWGWRSEIESWAKRHGETRVLEYNTGAAQRMAPATDRLYQAVASGTVTHDGDELLAAHIGNCVAKPTPMGDLVSKDKRMSTRKIDSAVAAIIAYDRAAVAQPPPEKIYHVYEF